jgi:hypothetical protein
MTNNQIKEHFWQMLTFLPNGDDFSQINAVIAPLNLKVKQTRMDDGSVIYHLVKLHHFLNLRKITIANCQFRLPDIYTNKVVSSDYLVWVSEVCNFLSKDDFSYTTENFIIERGNLAPLINSYRQAA